MGIFTFNRITVSAGQCALEYRDGTLGRVLPPGRHRIDVAASVVRVEMREQVLTLAPQEVLTSDAVTLRISVALQFKVSDAVAYVDTVIKSKMMEAELLRGQAAANTKEQFANSPDLNDELMNAVMDAMAAHQAMSKQALNSESVRARMLAVLLGPGELWEALRGGDGARPR